jgi:hypothetical protein
MNHNSLIAYQTWGLVVVIVAFMVITCVALFNWWNRRR